METKIDGKAMAHRLYRELVQDVEQLHKTYNIKPGLAVILVGADPASEIYVSNKAKTCREMGMESFDFRLPASATQAEVIAKIEELNKDPKVHGILVQLPLPKHMDETVIINTVDPRKDVDGFHVINAGKLATGQDGMVPCTPQGAMIMIKSVLGKSHLPGKHAVILGRSNIVGKPMAQLLLREHCTVTIAHSRSKDLPTICRQADILVVAVGKPELVRGEWIKEGAVVIDVGINRLVLGDGTKRLVGDVSYAEVMPHAKAITPVPGGVGPMTIACLLLNTVKAAKALLGAKP